MADRMLSDYWGPDQGIRVLLRKVEGERGLLEVGEPEVSRGGDGLLSPVTRVK